MRDVENDDPVQYPRYFDGVTHEDARIAVEHRCGIRRNHNPAPLAERPLRRGAEVLHVATGMWPHRCRAVRTLVIRAQQQHSAARPTDLHPHNPDPTCTKLAPVPAYANPSPPRPFD